MAGIDICFLLVFGVVTYCVASEGAWGAAVMSLVILISGLLAMNFFEPFANMLEGPLKERADFVSLVLLFGVFVLLLRLASEHLMPTFMQSPTLPYEFGRWGFGAFAGYVCAAILLTSLHTAPFPREFMGFTPERKNFFVAPDRQWLAFNQYVSEKVLGSGRVFDGPEKPQGGTIAPAYEKHNDRWPSFIIRYAHRREQLARPPEAAKPQVVKPTPRPGGGGGTGF